MAYDLELALAHYALMFPDVGALGEGNPPVAWKEEYDRVAALALSPTLAIGTSVNALRNFDQKTLLWALHLRPRMLDEDYVLPGELMPAVAVRRRIGITVRLGC